MICKSCIYFKPISWTVISVLVFGNAWNDCSFLPFSLSICSSGSHDVWKVWLWSKPSLNGTTCSISCYLSRIWERISPSWTSVFSIYRIRTLIHIYLIGKLWHFFLSLVSPIEMQDDPKPSYTPNPSIAHIVWNCVSLCRWNFFPHTSLHLMFTFFSTQIFPGCLIDTFSVHYVTISLSVSHGLRENLGFFCPHELRLAQMGSYMPNILFWDIPWNNLNYKINQSKFIPLIFIQSITTQSWSSFFLFFFHWGIYFNFSLLETSNIQNRNNKRY